jgi:hypothetical protein
LQPVSSFCNIFWNIPGSIMARKPILDVPSPSNPHAESIDAATLRKLVTDYYGTKTLLVDKALAETLLEYNTANRSLNRRKIDRLAEQMRTSTFENTGEPIILSREGVLNDGQHRLMALTEADVTVDLDVRFGIARKAFTKTNTGAERTSSDVLAIRGVAGGASIAPAVRLLVLYQRGLPDSIREFVSNAEVDEGFQRWTGFEAVAKQISGLRFPRGVRSTPLLTTAFLASRSSGADRLPGWLETLATGVGTGKSDPGYVLRERLLRGVDAAIGTRESLVERFALMVRSWNAYAAGRALTAKDLRWIAAGKLATPFPKVEGVRL